MDNQQPVIEGAEEEAVEVKTTKRDTFAWLVQRGFGLLGIGVGAALAKDSSGFVMILSCALGGAVGGGLGSLIENAIKKKHN